LWKFFLGIHVESGILNGVKDSYPKDRNSLDLYSNRILWLFILLVAALTVWIRIRLSSMPLERDEGEYAYMAQMILAGHPPFSEVYAMKFPGIYLLYTMGLFLFGETDVAIRIGLTIINFLTAYFVYLLGSRMTSKSSGLLCAATFLVLTLAPPLLGITANCEHFILLPVAIGTLFLFRAEKWKDYLVAGIFFGLAQSIKQQAVLFSLFGLFWTFFKISASPSPLGVIEKDLKIQGLKSVLFYLIGFFIPIVFMLGWMHSTGVFASFYFWCIQYSKYYGHTYHFIDAWLHFKVGFIPFFKDYLLLIILALIGLIILWRENRKTFFYAAFLLAAAVCATAPGFTFRPHYFLYLTLPLSLIIGCSFSSSLVSRLITMLALLLPFILGNRIFFRASPDEAARILYPQNAFSEAKQIALRLSKETQPGDRIGVFGSEPEIYFYSKRQSVTPFIYMYPLTEPQPFAESMQKRFMNMMEENPPKVLIHLKIPTSWSVYPQTDTTLLEWIPGFIQKHYSNEKKVMVPAYLNVPERHISIYERNSAF
jgi:hypothetical protein